MTRRPSAYDVFSYLTAEKADRYRAVMAAFVAMKERFQLHLWPSEVADLVDATWRTTLHSMRRMPPFRSTSKSIPNV